MQGWPLTLCAWALLRIPWLPPAAGSVQLLRQRLAALARERWPASSSAVVSSASLPALPVKTLVWAVNDSSAVVTVLPASASVNRTRLAVAVSASPRELRLAPPELAAELTGFPLGCIPPLGFSRPLPVLLEASLLKEGSAVIAGGGGTTDHHLYVSVEEYVRLSGAQPTELVNEDRPTGVRSDDSLAHELLLRLRRCSELRATPSVLRALSTSSKSLAPVAEMLVASGGDINECGSHGKTALHFASAGGTLFNVRALLDAGAAPDCPALCGGAEEGFTALMFAAAAGRSSVVDLLLERGADARVRSKRGYSALSLALLCGRLAHDTLARLRAVSDSNIPESMQEVPLGEDLWDPLQTARSAVWEQPSAGSVEVELEGRLASKRQVSRALLFANIVPPDSPMPEHPLQWFVWRGLAASSDQPCAVQVIIGKTLREAGGLDACVALCRKLRAGQVIRVRGRLQPSVEEANLDLIAREVAILPHLPSNASKPLDTALPWIHTPALIPSDLSPVSAPSQPNPAISVSSGASLTLAQVHRLCGHEERLTLVDDDAGLLALQTHFAAPSQPHLIGLDCEWRPERERNERHRVSLLQLSDGRASFVVDLQSLCGQDPQPGSQLSPTEQALDDILTELFRGKHTVVLGFSVAGDLTRLAASYPNLRCFREYNAVVDLFGQFKSLFPKSRAPSLSAVCALSFGCGLDKSHQTSAWHLRPLSEVQLSYAAVDAAVLVALMHEWLRRLQWNPRRISVEKVGALSSV